MKSPIVILLLVLIFLALVANLAMLAVTGESPIDEEMVKVIAFWGLVAANLTLAGAGVYFVSKAFGKTEKSSLVWARRGYAVNIVVTAVFALAPWFFYDYVKTKDFTRSDSMFEIALVLLLFGIPHAIFTLSSYKEYLRSAGSRPKRLHRDHSSAFGPSSGAPEGAESAR